MESKEIKTMRYMAWERVIGELRSMYQTYWNGDDKYKKFKETVEGFINEVEDNGLQE